MKLMPPEPTEEMMEAADNVAIIYSEWGVDPFIQNTEEVYKAMFAVAPNIEHEEIAKQIPEALRKAIIKDFVEGLKPKAFLYREISGHGFKETVSTNDVLGKFEVVNGKKVIPLYSLEEWK